MNVLASKLICVFFQIICFVIHTANLFMTDILMYEVSTGLAFDYTQLLHNRIFWIILVMQLVDVFVCTVLNHSAKSNDKIVEQAYANGTKKLINVTVDYAKSGDFFSAEKSMEILEKLEDRQKGR